MVSLLAVALAACAGGGGPGGGIEGGGSAGPIVGPVAEPQRHLVAVIVPLSGPEAGVGSSIANAASLALADTGAANVRLSRYDSAGAGGAAAAAAAAVRDGAGLILGPLLAADVRAVAPIARGAGVPVISYSNDSGVAGNGVYVMGFTPAQSIARVVAYTRGTGAGRYAALAPSGLYGERASQALLDAARQSGGRVTTIETYQRTPASVKAAAGRIRAKGGADAVLVADSARLAALAAPALGRAQILGTELWAADPTLGRTPGLKGALFAAAPNLRFAQLAAKYRARYRAAPSRLASLGYDSVLLVARAAPQWRIGTPFSARSLVARDGFAGVDGSFRFTRGGTAERLLEVRQVTATGTQVVSPAGSGF
ncbi:penicillin-binding protein activator [Sphingomonas sp. ASV193]|uniref:penicillin-binding protein activator n=1 Tax=Sphingomonas sp. ASV193 TaxID=3144405 RepID=UPI0032E906F1